MATKVELTKAPAAAVKCNLLAVPLFEEELSTAAGARPAGLLGELDRALEGHLARAIGAERFTGKPDSSLQLDTLAKLPSARVLLLGLGPRARAAATSEQGFEALRMAAGRAARAALQGGGGVLALALPAGTDEAGSARAVAEGALLGAYRFDRYRGKGSEDGGRSRLDGVSIVRAVERQAGAGPEVSSAARLGEKVAAAVAWARDRVNEAPVHCTPTLLAEAAEALSSAAGLTCEVLGPREIARLKMGMFMGVARGSAEEPRLVKVSWEPGATKARKSSKAGKGEGALRRAGGGPAPLVLVGKAVTFDSGGLSIKPTDSMVTMNTDMAGAAAVLGAMELVAELAPPFPVLALVGAAENMPGGRAYKPSDVLTACDGRTVEVNNTDAEGRLILGDLLAWARMTLRPAGMVDLATLTGACVVALGQHTAGAFGPDGAVIEVLLAAARSAGEDTWRMPLVPAVKETLRSDVADMKNTGERWGGAISAAHFLHAFAGDVPWAHLDIAGPARSAKERGYLSKGGTGFGVRTLVELVRGWKPA